MRQDEITDLDLISRIPDVDDVPLGMLLGLVDDDVFDADADVVPVAQFQSSV